MTVPSSSASSAVRRSSSSASSNWPETIIVLASTSWASSLSPVAPTASAAASARSATARARSVSETRASARDWRLRTWALIAVGGSSGSSPTASLEAGHPLLLAPEVAQQLGPVGEQLCAALRGGRLAGLGEGLVQEGESAVGVSGPVGGAAGPRQEFHVVDRGALRGVGHLTPELQRQLEMPARRHRRRGARRPPSPRGPRRAARAARRGRRASGARAWWRCRDRRRRGPRRGARWPRRRRDAARPARAGAGLRGWRCVPVRGAARTRARIGPPPATAARPPRAVRRAARPRAAAATVISSQSGTQRAAADTTRSRCWALSESRSARASTTSRRDGGR